MAVLNQDTNSEPLKSAQGNIEDKLNIYIRMFEQALRIQSPNLREAELGNARRYLLKFITTETTKARIDELKSLPLSDYEDVTDDGDETWFEYISLEDRDKRLAALQKEHHDS